MSSQWYIILPVTILVALLLVWLEWRRASTRNRAIRMIAVLAAAAALLFLAQRPGYRATRTTVGTLVTQGAPDSVKTRGENVFTPQTLFASGDTGIRRWMIAGYGLTTGELSAIKPVITRHVYKEITAAITAVHWNEETEAGMPLQVQGTCINNTGHQLRLVLEGYGHIQDSITIPAKQSTQFRLQSPVKHNGRGVFRLQLRDGKKILEDNPVPVLALQRKPLRLLVLASSPDFENRFLYRWLGEEGFPAAIRTRISRDKYQQSFINHKNIPLSKITDVLLDSFDVLLADAAALDNLGAGEKQVLESQVSRPGLGLLVRADSLLRGNLFYNRFAQKIQPAGASRQLQPVLATGEALRPLPAEYILTIGRSETQQTWVSDAAGHTLVAGSLYGAGKIALSGIDNTYQWQLSGNSDAYKKYWSELLQRLAKPVSSTAEFTLPSTLPVKGSRATIALQREGAADAPVTVVEGSVLQPLATTVPYNWQYDYWPQTSGWQQLRSEGVVKDWYVFDGNDWPGVRAMERIQATRAWIQQYGLDDGAAAANGEPAVLPWLLLFLFSVMVLWVERKFFS